jgi:NAD-dependent SIR2 family protein deacetylase
MPPLTLRGNPAYLSSVARDALASAQEAHQKGRLGFLVGAGLSTAIGLPGWGAFNQALVDGAFSRHLPGDAPHSDVARAYVEALHGQTLAAIDFVRRRAGSEFHVVLREALYERKQLRAYAPTEVHYALCSLAMESSPPWPCVHTTNYDDLLELALQQVSGKKAKAVHASRRHWSDGPRVVHLHGYFPYEGPPQAHKNRLAREIIVSDLDYSRLSNDHAGWTNRELLALLDARSVLITGMSMTDPNVRRLFAYLSDRRRPGDDGPEHFVVLVNRVPEGDGPAHTEAARLLDEDEHEFWKSLGVKILRLPGWDRLNYLLRRIRFADHEFDKQHRAVRLAWARHNIGPVRLEDDAVQSLGTSALAAARDEAANAVGLDGRVEINLFLPLPDGSYKRVFSSMKGRAMEAPRPFQPAHDRASIPEVESALTLGQASLRSDVKPMDAPAGQPPFQTWYRSLMSVPFFDDAAGGVPVAVIQLCSSERDLSEKLDAARLASLREQLREAVRQVCGLIRGFALTWREGGPHSEA